MTAKLLYGSFVRSLYLLFLVGALVALGQPVGAQTKLALLAGVEKYERDGFEPLHFAEDDALELKIELEKLGFKTAAIVGKDATLVGLEKGLSSLYARSKKLKRDDVVIVFLSGHGVQKLVRRTDNGKMIETEEPFFCPIDAHKNDISTLLSMNDLLHRLEEDSGASNNIVFLDACRESSDKGGKGLDGSKIELPNKIALFFAAQSGHRSFESRTLKHGIFTHYLLEGLRGKAADDENEITLQSLASYVSKRVQKDSPELLRVSESDAQLPNLMGSLRGSLLLGKVELKKQLSITSSGESETDVVSPSHDLGMLPQILLIGGGGGLLFFAVAILVSVRSKGRKLRQNHNITHDELPTHFSSQKSNDQLKVGSPTLPKQNIGSASNELKEKMRAKQSSIATINRSVDDLAPESQTSQLAANEINLLEAPSQSEDRNQNSDVQTFKVGRSVQEGTNDSKNPVGQIPSKPDLPKSQIPKSVKIGLLAVVGLIAAILSESVIENLKKPTSLAENHSRSIPTNPPSSSSSGTGMGGSTMTNSVGMKLVLIKAGSFMMGSPETEAGRSDDERQHQVTLTADYYLGETEVTQGQWKSVMGTKPWKHGLAAKEGLNYPATYVSWDDAVEFCKKLSEREGKRYRLPTEAEWEYACRGGTSTSYGFGNIEWDLARYGWFLQNTSAKGEEYAREVKQKLANPFGLYDMHGNVWEWCSDWYADFPYSEIKDPTGPSASGPGRVNRGGSSINYASSCRSAYRNRYTQDYRNDNLGFRVAVGR